MGSDAYVFINPIAMPWKGYIVLYTYPDHRYMYVGVVRPHMTDCRFHECMVHQDKDR